MKFMHEIYNLGCRIRSLSRMDNSDQSRTSGRMWNNKGGR